MSRQRLIVSAITVLAALSATARSDDWPTFQHDVHHTGRSTATIDPRNLHLVWESPKNAGAPIVVGDTVYTVATDLMAFNLADGTVRWSVPRPDGIASSVSYADGLLVFTVRETQRLYVHDAATGSFRYSVYLTDGWVYVPTLYRNSTTNQLLAFLSATDRITAVELRESSGSVLWALSIPLDRAAIPTVAGESVILVTPATYYAVHQLTGDINVFYTTGGSGGGGHTPVYDDGRSQIYILTLQGLTAWRYIDNEHIIRVWWVTRGLEIKAGNSFALGPDGALYTGYFYLAKIDPDDGTILHRGTGPLVANGSAPMLSPGYLWTFSDRENLIFDLETFELITTLSGSRGNSNTAIKTIYALKDNYALLDIEPLFSFDGYPTFSVFTSFPDCNNNGISDEDDLRTGASLDCNDNDTPDECEVDSDGDGVIDDCDPCPNENPDDADADGTCFPQDQCPTDANKTQPGQCGCGASDVDSDGDTIANCNDQCPGRDDRVDANNDGTPDCVANIPAVSDWGLTILMLLLLIMAKAHFGRACRNRT